MATSTAWSKPGVVFTWKSEFSGPPFFQIDTPPKWNTQIANRGHAVIAGLPVTAVLEWDADLRPALIQTVDLYGHFDSRIHGWRAWSYNAVRRVDCTDPDRPRLLRETAPSQ